MQRSHADENAAARPVGRAVIANLLASVGFGLIAMTICVPSLPQWGALFSATQSEVQLSFSSFVLGLGAAQLFYGPLSDRHGRRPFLLFGFMLAAVASVACALAPNLDVLIVARFVQGAGAAAGMVIGRAMVQDYFSGADRPRVMAYVGMMMGTCPPLATIVGGQLHVHWGWQANFWLTACVAIILVLTTWWILPAQTGAQNPAAAQAHWFGDMMRAYGRLLREPEFLIYAAILGMCTGTFYVFLAGAPTVLASYSVGPDKVGFFIMFVPFSYIAGNFLTSRLIKNMTERHIMMWGQVAAVLGIGIMLLLALAGVASPFALVCPLILLGIGHGLLMPSTLSGTVAVIPALAGAAAGAAGLTQHLFGAFGGYAVGFVDHRSATNLAALMLAFMLFSLWCQLVLRRVPRRAQA